MSSQAMKRHGGNLHVYYRVKEGNIKGLLMTIILEPLAVNGFVLKIVDLQAFILLGRQDELLEYQGKKSGFLFVLIMLSFPFYFVLFYLYCLMV